MITKIEIILIGDKIPENVDPKNFPQIVLSSHPDLNSKQWVALSAAIIKSVDKAGIVNVDEFLGGLNEK